MARGPIRAKVRFFGGLGFLLLVSALTDARAQTAVKTQ
jgi:hypothetical protein